MSDSAPCIQTGIDLLFNIANVAFAPFGGAGSTPVSSVEEILSQLGGTDTLPGAPQAVSQQGTQINALYGAYQACLDGGIAIPPAGQTGTPQFSDLYNFLEQQVGQTGADTVYSAIQQLVLPGSAAGVNAVNNQQALALPALVFGVSALVHMTMTKMAIDAQRGNPDNVNLADAQQLLQWLTAAGVLAGDPAIQGWTGYMTSVSGTLINQLGARMAMVTSAIPYTWSSGPLDALTTFLAYFVDNGQALQQIPGFSPDMVNAPFAASGLPALPGDGSAQIALGVNPATIYSLGGTSWVALASPPDNSACLDKVSSARATYCTAMTQAICNNYFDPGAMDAPAKTLNEAAAKMQVVVNAGAAPSGAAADAAATG